MVAFTHGNREPPKPVIGLKSSDRSFADLESIQIRFVMTTASTSAHWPQNSHVRSMIEQKPSLEGGVSHSSKPSLSLTLPCERAATISFALRAEFSDTKVLNVVTRSTAIATSKTSKRLCCFDAVDWISTHDNAGWTTNFDAIATTFSTHHARFRIQIQLEP